jgi:GNAT superfamily N-acetyltransferase
MELDRLFLIRVREAIHDFRVGGLEPVWIDRDASAPPELPDFFWSRPLFALEVSNAPVGELSLWIHSREGRPVLSVRRFVLQPDLQGRGVARALHAHLDLRLPDLGIDRVEIEASGAGSYAWARLGYHFDLAAYGRLSRYEGLADPQILADVRAGLLRGTTPHEWPISAEVGGSVVPASAGDSVQRMLASLAQANDQNAEVVNDLKSQLNGAKKTRLDSPERIALYGRDLEVEGIPNDSWLGRELMIRAAWIGIRRLGS